MDNNYDVIIIGGGPAGLNAAIVLGRSRRRVLICDSGRPRNFKAKFMHGYLTRDGIKPLEFLRLGSEELKRYDIKKCQMEISSVIPHTQGFEVVSSEGERFYSKKILLATGITDNIPQIEGIDEFYGSSVFHCPYCDGWEVRDTRFAVYARGKAALALSLSLKTWSNDVILVSDGFARLSRKDKETLEWHDVRIYTGKIARLEGRGGLLQRIVFVNGSSLERDVMFFSTGQKQKSNIAEMLGCRFNDKGFIPTNKKQQTNIKGIFAAGDITKDVKFVVVAAAEGARAGVAINMELQEEERPALKRENPVANT
ncbi:MAG: NAD(P)/FAD-dependent oxidoreductase [Ignavibacteria bacterium]|nr:NAD(P)/FAD-dependent oxidoreductase [Ignavibacteria bacterium]MCU7503892.1 NAD(P)/FAD-dependent oxidoreductase [Ignavibacteria bacterium]MCU7515887.1 NAD(P)/FAD-dependent oxidoreductase [Ignavibacteria bacterium]